MHKILAKTGLRRLQFFPLCLLPVLTACSETTSPSAPDGTDPTGYTASASSSELALDFKLTLKPGKSSVLPVLAAARDDTTSDSLNLYIDVAIENIGPQVLLLPQQADSFNLRARVSFVDVPFKKNFYLGRLKLVVGWTAGGLQASEIVQVEFDTDSTLAFSVPLSRVDSFHVADNVAVYGEVLSKGRYIIADRIREFETAAAPKTTPAADLVGFVREVDAKNSRLYVSNATVVLTDSTLIQSSSGKTISAQELHSGANEFTVTAQAWAYRATVGMVADGWEFKRFTVFVTRPLAP